MLYRGLNDQKDRFNLLLREVSHAEIASLPQIENPVVFAYSRRSFVENIEMLEKLHNKIVGSLIYISSSSVLAVPRCEIYQYPKAKLMLEKYIVSKYQKYSIIRVGIPDFIGGIDLNRNFAGTIKVTGRKELIAAIEESVVDGVEGGKVVGAYTNKDIHGGIKNQLFYRLYFYLEMLLPGKMFYLTRGIDVIAKKVGFMNYGYTYLSNAV